MNLKEEPMKLGMALQRPRLVAALACFVLGMVILAVAMLPSATAQNPPDEALAAAELPTDEPVPPADATEAAPRELVVYVSGAVLRPDVYRLPSGARVKDAVAAAGGLRLDAAAEQLNLAQTLADAAHVHVPSVTDIVALAPAAPAAAGRSAGPLDLNRATVADLDELPGIGQVLAERIVARRTEAGPYTAVEELREVTGIGAKLYSQIAPLVTVGPS